MTVKEYVFFSTGSNIGDRKAYLAKAIQMIEHSMGKLIQKSSLYETDAWGNTEQAPFLNQILLLETACKPKEILQKIKSIEQQLGRQRKEHWGARTIDIDILFFGNRIINEKGLNIPHPRLHLRNFVLVPLSEIAPHLVHPILNKTIEELRISCEDTLNINIITQ